MLRGLFLLASLGVLGCGEGSPTDCACTITVETETLTLGCGESGCVAGGRYGCEEDNVQALGRCGGDLGGSTVVDDGDGGQCLAPTSGCEGTTLACCARTTPSGLLAPSCDVITRRCCVSVGERCETSADCCSGHACTASGDTLRCAS